MDGFNAQSSGMNKVRAHRRFNPNLQSIRATDGKGTHRRVRVCTRCLRSGKVIKPTRAAKPKPVATA